MRGAVWTLLLNTDGTVKSHPKISATEGGFTGTLDGGDEFGWSVAALGDLDSDRVGDLAVGTIGDDDGGDLRRAVWVLFLDCVPACHADLNGDGSVGASDLLILLGFWGPCSPVCLGDFDGDDNVGVSDLLALLANWGPCP